ncbi:hypothetical protein ACFO3O_21260 [Dokdonia ponticola]|uniref:YD repeat-containing protein n=1 Tax=Dokdonia ponticola TaxID=2041041 RepID=A0ABV9I2U9_9FLAO
MNRTFFIRTLLLVFLISIYPLNAQDGGGGSFNYANELSQRAGIPQSPEAAAFGRYGDVAVNMYSGTPNIAVPIYTHKGREFDLSMGLTYDASGIRVNQLPTPVGLGWNFDVGGRISRVVNGLPDDYFSATSIANYKSWYDGIVRSNMMTYSDISYSFGDAFGGSKTYPSEQAAKNYIEFLDKLHKQEYDTQPDMFMVNAPGLSETFVFDLTSQTPYALNNPNTIIQVVSGNLTLTNAGGVTTFKVITDNGTQYFFDAVEQTETTKDNDTESHFQNSARVRFTSSWYLTKIISPLGKDTYEFEYIPYVDYRNTGISNVMTEKTTIITGPPEDNTSQYSRANTSTRFFDRKTINKIIHNDKVIVRVDATPQFDGGPDVAITSISTYADGDTNTGFGLLKNYQLEYSYFKTSTSVPINTTQELNLRLKLDRVIVKDDNLQEVYDYTFDYIDPFLMPSLSSLNQDYLGYYNGNVNNSSLIPGSSLNNNAGDNAYRGANFIFAKKGLLNKITYPTGGHTIFEYEQAQLRYPEVNEQTQTINKINLIHSPSSLPPYNANQCNMQNNSTAITANVTTQSFEIANGEDGTHFLEYSKSGTPNTTSLFSVPRQAVLIKKEDPTITYTWSDVFDSNCEILINPSFLIWEATNEIGIQNVSFSLGVGHYQVLIPVYDTGFSKMITIDGPDPIQVTTYVEEPKAGIRVKRIKDYIDATTLVKQKEYTYNHTVQISNPIFEYITSEKRHPDTDLSDPSPAPEDYQLLHVMAQPINGDIEHIVGKSVTEHIIDINDPSNSLSKSYSFNTPNSSQAVYGKGNYQLVVSGTGGYFSSSHYSKLPSFGSVKSESTTTSQSSSEFSSPRLHYQTFGLAVAPIGSNSVLYPTVAPNPNTNQGGWKIIMAPAKFVTTIGGPPTPVTPDECNGEENCRPELARLKLHKTNVYGYHGGEVSQTTTTVDGVITSTEYTYTEGDTRYPKTMITSATSSPTQKTVYTYPFEVLEVTSVDPNEEECYVIINGTIIYICDQSGNPNGTYTYPQLVNANMINQPVLIQQYDGIGSAEKLTSRVLTEYQGLLPQTIFTSKTVDEDFEPRMSFEQYENNNLIQARQEDGTPVSFIWGYNNRYVVAKISNIDYNSIPPTLITAIKNNSDNLNQSALLTSLETLQNDAALANSMMTYYTYIPNIGVTTMTNETGYRMQYFYDDLQRLERVEDQQGNVLSQNEYNYKN